MVVPIVVTQLRYESMVENNMPIEFDPPLEYNIGMVVVCHPDIYPYKGTIVATAPAYGERHWLCDIEWADQHKSKMAVGQTLMLPLDIYNKYYVRKL